MDSGVVVVLFAIAIAVVVVLLTRGKKAGTSGADPVAEAEVYLTYGRRKEAKALLEKHVQLHPGDEKAMQLHRKCQ
jgi:preprotein translocase subunit SecG